MIRKGRRLPAVIAAASVALSLLAACGTRLPDSSFTAAGQIIGTQTSGAVAPGQVETDGGTGKNNSGTGTTTIGGGNPTTGSSAGTTTTGDGTTTTTSGLGHEKGGVGTSTASSKGNFASAPGVTATTITIGNISSKTNPFDPRAFVGPLYGLDAFARYINAHGGIHGRELIVKPCDDQGDGTTDVNCVQQLISSDKVFSLVSNAILNYQGAAQVNSAGVPDIGSQPIDTPYDQYPNLYDIYGENYPRTGKGIGFDGKLYGGTETYHYFKVHYPKVPLKAGVVEYDESSSERFGQSIVAGLQKEGYQVTEKTVNFALPDFDSAAIAFKNAGDEYIYDTIDREGNVRLCDALQDNSVPFFAKVVTTQSWEQSVNSDYSSAKGCANKLWTSGNTRNYEDTQYPEVAEFRKQMSADGDGGPDQLSEWALEGWAGAQWFADAATSCGADLTRACVEKYMNRKTPYDGHGLLTPRTFSHATSQPARVHNCINMAHWSVAKDTWITATPNMDADCFEVYNLGYSP